MSDPEKQEVPVKPTRPTRDPSALTPEYHKAHKQLMLWSAILFIWELVGVDLGKAKDAGGYVGPVVTALKSPQAVPWVLLALVIYFLIKCSIEWGQCHLDRRRIRFARIDFFGAWFVALAAIALYIGQTISRAQFADLISGSPARSFMVGASWVVPLTLVLIRRPSDRFDYLLLTIMSLVIVAFSVAQVYVGFRWGASVIGLTSGVVVVAAFVVTIKQLRRRSAQKVTHLP